MVSWTMPIAILAGFCVATSARGDLCFDSPRVDLGIAHAGKHIRHQFTFRVTGNEPVVISNILASCGCVSGTLAKQIFEPGEAGAIELRLHTISQAEGPQRWTLRVQYRQGEANQEAVLEATGILKALVRVTPSALVIPANPLLSHKIEIIDSSPRPLRITRVEPRSPRILLEPPQLEAGAGKEKWIIQLRPAQAIAEGRHEEAVSVFTDSLEYPELVIPITITQRSKTRYSVLPARVDLPAGGQASRLLIIRDDEKGEPVEIERAEVNHPSIACKWSEGSMKTASIRVQREQPSQEGDPEEAWLIIKISKPVSDVALVPVRLR